MSSTQIPCTHAHNRCLAALLVCAHLAISLGCATKPIQSGIQGVRGRPGDEEIERIHVKPNQTIGFVWNRWREDTENKIFVNGGEILASRYLPRLLEPEASPEVSQALDQYQKWSDVGQIASITFAASAVLAGLGYIPITDGGNTLPIGIINILWVISGAALGTTVYSLMKEESALSEALQLHNQKVRAGGSTPAQKSAALLNWEFKF